MKNNYICNFSMTAIFTVVLFAISFCWTIPTSAQIIPDPNFNAGVTESFNVLNKSVVQPDGKILIGGYFTKVNGVDRRRIERLNADGTRDLTFNPGGSGISDGNVLHIVLQPDGKILISGNFYRYNDVEVSRNILRLNSDGTIDQTFNAGSGGNRAIEHLVLQPDGKIVVVGDFTEFNGASHTRIVRLNAEGSLDTTFNSGSGTNSIIFEVARQSDEKIIIVGTFTTYNGITANRIARLNTDGTFDASFMIGSGIPPNPGDNVLSVIIDPNDKIFVAGAFQLINGVATSGIARLNADGSIDGSFTRNNGDYIQGITLQPDGKIIISGIVDNPNNVGVLRLNNDGSKDNTFQPSQVPNPVGTITVQADGKIIIGGTFTNYGNTDRRTLLRLEANGTIDPSFNTEVTTAGRVHTIFQQPDGKILVAGNLLLANGVRRSNIARFNLDGSLDTTFNTAMFPTYEAIEAVAVQSDGKILIGGNFTVTGQFTAQPILLNHLARLNTDGSLDTTLNNTLNTSTVRSIRIQSDGKILVGGGFTDVSGSNRGLVRLNVDGSHDTSFDSGAGADNQVVDLEIQPDGKIIAVGSFRSYNGVARERIVRLNADGTLDSAFGNSAGSNGFIVDSALQNDGKIVIGGFFTTFDGISRNRIARLNSDGSLDTTFDVGTGANNGVNSVAVKADGKIFIGGFFTTYNNSPNNFLAQINSNGSFDTSFISGFTNSLTSPTEVLEIFQQLDGKTLIGGIFKTYAGINKNSLLRFSQSEIGNSTQIGINPKTTFLITDNTDTEALSASAIDLQALGYFPGDAIKIERLGAFSLFNVPGAPNPLPDSSTRMVGIFSSTNELLERSNRTRVPGAIATNLPQITTGTTLMKGKQSDIPEDFNVNGQNGSSVSVVIPNNVRYLFVAPFDGFYGDNLDPNGDYAVRISKTLVISGRVTDASVGVANTTLLLGGTTSGSTVTDANGNYSFSDLTTGGNYSVTPAETGTIYNPVSYSFNNLTDSQTADFAVVCSYSINPIGASFNSSADADNFVISTQTGCNWEAASNENWLTITNGNNGTGNSTINYAITENTTGQSRTGTINVAGKTFTVNQRAAGASQNQPILFFTNRDGNNEIYKMSEDGTNQERLTFTAESEFDAYWSPDGSKILYVKQINATRQIWTMNSDGSNKVLVSDATGVNSQASWSPDGQKILFSRTDNNGFSQVWTMNANGSNKEQLTNVAFRNSGMKWSPDGSKIAFGRCDTSNVCDVYTINSDGTNETNLTPANPNDDDVPLWTPDGSRIIYLSSPNGSDFNTYIMNADGMNKQPLTNSTSPEFHFPQGISPDGSLIAMNYQTTVSGPTGREISTVGIDGSNLTNVTNNSSWDIFSAFSPDGSKIAFRQRIGTPFKIFIMNADGSNQVQITNGEFSEAVTDWREEIAPQNSAPFDFDGDSKTDISIFRPNVGEWWYLRSSDLDNRALQFGSSTDIPVPADFTGDGKTDIAFWRNGEWFILRSEDSSFFSFPFGASGDIPAPGDFDGDGKADPTVFRPSQGVWFVSKTTGGTDIIPFGISEDKPVVADYDGDGKDDIGIFRPSVSQWWINRSQDGLAVVQFGSTGDKTVPGDYTGDGKADIAFFRPSNGEWFIVRSEDSSFFSFPFGTNGDIAAPGDYDGDGIFDTAVFRPSQTTWYLNTTSNGVQIVGFGANGDVPIPSVFSRP